MTPLIILSAAKRANWGPFSELRDWSWKLGSGIWELWELWAGVGGIWSTTKRNAKPKPPPGAAPPEVAANEMLSKLNFCITNCNADNLCKITKKGERGRKVGESNELNNINLLTLWAAIARIPWRRNNSYHILLGSSKDG